ncbi:MAG: flotillin domain-containing protein, partial [Pseudomonadota bacterium]
ASEVASEQAVRNREAEEARITAKQKIDSTQIEADRAVKEASIAQQQAIEIARQEQQIAIQNKSREESQAKAEADEARAKAVAAEEQVTTSRETEAADREKRIELIEASKQAERQAIGVKVEAEAEKEAAVNRAAAIRLDAEGEAEAEKLRADAARVRFEVEASGQRAINEAANILSSDQISLQTKLALLNVLPDVVRESAKPMEAIDSIKIVQVDGITQNGGGGSGAPVGANGSGNGNLATDAVSAALSYRAQAPVIDGLMKELGLDGSSLDSLISGAADKSAANDATLLQPESATKIEKPVAKSEGETKPSIKVSHKTVDKPTNLKSDGQAQSATSQPD